MIDSTDHDSHEAASEIRRRVAIDEMNWADVLEDDLSAFNPVNQWPAIWREVAHILKTDHKTWRPTHVGIPDKVENLVALGELVGAYV